MRSWLKKLNAQERDDVHEVEYLFHRTFHSKEEFDEIKALLPEDALQHGYGRLEFFQTYPYMKPYKKAYVIKNEERKKKG